MCYVLSDAGRVEQHRAREAISITRNGANKATGTESKEQTVE